MKLFYIFLIVFLLFSCQAAEKNIIKADKPVEQQVPVSAAVPQPQITRESNVPLLNDIPVFNGVIEDFENNLLFWKNSEGTTFIKQMEMNKGIGAFSYPAVFSVEEFGNNVKVIRYNRKMDFSHYKGISFFAKGTPGITFKIKILEKDIIYQGKDIEEVWFSPFAIKPDWQEYRIYFRDMKVEEYWEQDNISDNKQIFVDVLGIAITAQNLLTPRINTGELYLDNIVLF